MTNEWSYCTKEQLQTVRTYKEHCNLNVVKSFTQECNLTEIYFKNV